MHEQLKVPLRLLVTKKVGDIGGGENPETIEIKGYGIKELSHLVDQYH